jgi:hypothetical protein
MSPRFNHVVAFLSILFFFYHEEYCVAFMLYSLCIHFSVDQHWDGSITLDIMNNAAVNIYQHICARSCVFHSHDLQVRLLGHIGLIFFL